MRNLRKVCAAVLLTLAIAVPTFPGEISCPGVSAYHEHSLSVSGEISCPGNSLTSEPDAPEISPATTALDPVTSFTMGLLQSLMSLF